MIVYPKVFTRKGVEERIITKRGLLPFRHEVHLSNGMSPKTLEEMEQMAKVPSASALGSLMYTMLCTRHDIAYAISVSSRFQSNPGLEH